MCEGFYRNLYASRSQTKEVPKRVVFLGCLEAFLENINFIYDICVAHDLRWMDVNILAKIPFIALTRLTRYNMYTGKLYATCLATACMPVLAYIINELSHSAQQTEKVTVQCIE